MKTRQKTKLILSILFLLFSLYIATIMVSYTNKIYPDLVISTDVFFKILPFINLSVFSDILSIIGPILFVIFVFSKKTTIKKIPYYATIIGIFYLIRSFFIYVAPLANPFPLEKWGLGIFPVGGMFPSGHTGILFLMFLLIKEEPKSNSRYLAFTLLLLALLEGIFMIFSRGHYSLDVFGALLISYALHAFSKNHLQKKLLL
ncbi:MAG: phosphatase PAP2-related protein [Candidatus Pacearchaeota archaeon]|nr:phosphatase PAP2-related protein [Candidatus Pacearchaeota archaeon]